MSGSSRSWNTRGGAVGSPARTAEWSPSWSCRLGAIQQSFRRMRPFRTLPARVLNLRAPYPLHAGSCKCSGNRKRHFAALLQSPLTDSNRRPPPYHALRAAPGRNPRQRFWHDLAPVADTRLAADCHCLQPRGSIKAPSSVVHCAYIPATAVAFVRQRAEFQIAPRSRCNRWGTSV
jgi:hypothetical protein